MNHLEIEYKSGLNKEQFERLLPLFKDIIPVKQTNYYIDTPDFFIRDHKMAFRIRRFDDSAELTLKISQEVGTMEYNQALSADEVHSIIENMTLPEGQILENLKKTKIQLNQLDILGHLTTIRREMKHEFGLLALDENFYFDIHDYEIELEVQDAEDGKVNFFDFLQENNLPYTPLKSKIARFAKNLPNS